MAELTAARAGELLHYDPVSGTLYWRVKRNGRNGGVRPGDPAGSRFKGYLIVGVEGRSYLAHRLAWLLAHGRWPVGELDHRDGDRANNRLDNLRDVTHQVNMQNQHGATKGNRTTKLIGCSEHRPGRFVAYTHIGGRKKHLGMFASAEEAHAEHLRARREAYEGNLL